jgi:hypothetical protein
VGELEFEVTEKFIYEAIQLPNTGQKWTKGQPVDKKLCTQLLQPQYRKLQWSDSTSRSWLEPKWAQLLAILQRYLTCKGWYAIMFSCHARLLLHFKGNHLMNIPYFLLKSLKKMAEQVRKAKDFRGSLFHFGLVKILIKSLLSHKQETWDMFVVRTLASDKSRDTNAKSAPPQKKSNSRKKGVKTLTKICDDPKNTPDCTIEANVDNPGAEHSFGVHGSDGVETNHERVENIVPIEENVEILISPPTATNIIDVEQIEELVDKPRRNPKRKCTCTLSDMDNSVPNYPPQERLKSMDDHEEAPESSEMTLTLSQLIQKVHKVNWQANAPKEIEQDKPIQKLVDTPVQVYKEFTPELSPVENPDQVYDEFTLELSPDNYLVQVYDEFTPEPSPVDTHDQRPDDFTHASSPPIQQGHGKIFESYYEISSSKSLRPMVARLESRNHRLKEKLHEYTILDRHIKTENELMKLKQTHFSSKIE